MKINSLKLNKNNSKFDTLKPFRVFIKNLCLYLKIKSGLSFITG